MAYVALLGLSQTLNDILSHEEFTIPHKKETIVALIINVSSLLSFLVDYSRKFTGAVNPLEDQILAAAYYAEDIIVYKVVDEDIRRFQCSSSPLSDFWLGNLRRYFSIPICWLTRRRESAALQKVLHNIELILEEAMMIKDKAPAENVSLPDVSGYTSLSTDVSSGINTVLIQDDFMLMKERMYSNKSCTFEVIPIVGMGGIGKSTLARKLYEDSVKNGHFDRCIWVVVSQDYSLQRLLLDIVLSLGKPATSDLKQVIYQELFGRRYVIVVDDLWSEKAWDDLKVILPKNVDGSRVLVTTRLVEVANYVRSTSNPAHEIQLMNEFHSWMLFEERVFGEGSPCPPDLEHIGKKVAKSCQGLPLTIVVVAGLLKGNMTKEYWESTSENISSSEPHIAKHCSKVLSLSYNHLPLYLKPCFLYVTAFPEDCEIKVNNLIRMWMAEGFVKPSRSKLLEEVAEGYLRDLVARNLLMVAEKAKCDDQIKTIRIHDVLWDFGISTAQQEGFHYHRDLGRGYYRSTREFFHSLPPKKFRKPETRSVIQPNGRWDEQPYANLRLLRVLYAFIIFMNYKVNQFIHLRYLSLRFEGENFLQSNREIRNIQTLIFQEVDNYIVPLKIWKTPSLRHLILSPWCSLEHPSEDDLIEKTSLQTIRASNLQFTPKVLEMIPNLRKLRLHYTKRGHLDNIYDYDLINIEHLQKLEKLKIRFYDVRSPWFSDLAFPNSLKKLSLICIKGRWKDMSVVGSLPYLHVFKLENFYPEVGLWEPIEGQFLKLKHLRLKFCKLYHWDAESVHFPSLEVLVINLSPSLNEIPSGIGEIDTLRVMKYYGYNKSTEDSARQIQANQWEMGNQQLQLFVKRNSKYEEIRPENY